MHSWARVTEAVFGTSFSRIRILRIHEGYGRSRSTLNVLHCFHHLEILQLHGVVSSLYPNDADLPLLQTLQELSIYGGCAKWLDGHTFVQLTSLNVGGLFSWQDSFPNRVDVPVCTHISFGASCLEFLPVFQAAFVFPLLVEWNTCGGFQCSEETALSVVDAFSRIRARAFQFTFSNQYEYLLMAIQPKYELETLSMEFDHDTRAVNKFLIGLTEVIVDYSLTKPTNTSFDTQTIPTCAIATNHARHKSKRMIACPNLKVLELEVWTTVRGEIRQCCVEMMEGRMRAGCPLDRCAIWWDTPSHEGDPSLVLVTSNEGIITDE